MQTLGDPLAVTGPSLKTVPVQGRFNFTTWSDDGFSGTYQVERQPINNGKWHPCTDLGVVVVFTGVCTEICEEPQPGVLYRVNVLTRVNGTLNWAISQ